MGINWKLRFMNKATLTAIILAVISLVYKIISIAGAVPGIGENEVVNVAVMVIDILVLCGVVIDPTTEGIQDSERAMNYPEPFRKEG